MEEKGGGAGDSNERLSSLTLGVSRHGWFSGPPRSEPEKTPLWGFWTVQPQLEKSAPFQKEEGFGLLEAHGGHRSPTRQFSYSSYRFTLYHSRDNHQARCVLSSHLRPRETLSAGFTYSPFYRRGNWSQRGYVGS